MNKKIIDECRKTLNGVRIGTTIVALARSGNQIGVVHAGDSRCYRVRNSRMERITRDHTNLEYRFPNDEDRQYATLRSNKRFYQTILQSVGWAEEVAPTACQFEAHAGDIYLLCTDGLASPSRHVSDEEIQEILLIHPQPESAAEKLISAALYAGGHDNSTVIVIVVD